MDNLVTAGLYGKALGVHPAAVLIAAIVAANLLGVIGLLRAAPVLATLTLFGRYAARKMFDLDPWPEGGQEDAEVPSIPGSQALRRLLERLRARRRRADGDQQSEPQDEDEPQQAPPP